MRRACHFCERWSERRKVPLPTDPPFRRRRHSFDQCRPVCAIPMLYSPETVQ